MESEIIHLVYVLKSTFEKNAWHGPAVKEVLADITPEQAQLRFSTSHSIIELVAHMTSWRIFVTRKLQGDTHYKVSDEQNFPIVSDWYIVLRALEESQVNLLQALQQFPYSRLEEKVPHSEYNYTYYTLIHGIIHHDLYHLGQIVLLKKTA
ncbi:MAG TPA: DinB family protein [Ohtaekwangia sp.]|uniref:DinB family protein n=1 Tax=Ohtaekwangia sp. TaxID=2066019 RepID=UPI002F926B53